jgi:Tfp pilus assembly protein PilF
MSGRCRWHLGLLIVGLLPSAGCVGMLPASLGGTASTTEGQAAGTRAPDLPTAQKAKITLAVAQDLERAGHEEQAIQEYERARSYNPSLKNIARHLGPLYDRVGQHKRAMEEYERAIKESPRDADLCNDLGYHYYSLGKWTEAEAQYRHALQLNPKHLKAWNNLGLALAQQGRYDDSLKAFSKVVSPGAAYSNVAFVLTAQGKREAAREAYLKALQLEPNLLIARKALQKLDQPNAPPAPAKTTNVARFSPPAAPPPPVQEGPPVVLQPSLPNAALPAPPTAVASAPQASTHSFVEDMPPGPLDLQPPQIPEPGQVQVPGRN